MNQFKFRLQGLLKLREFKEHKAKIELGKINQQISDVQSELARLSRHIDEGYNSQEKFLEKPTPARMIQFFPYFNHGIREHIKSMHLKLNELNQKYNEKMKELNRLKGEVDVIEKLKEKEKKKFIKKIEKKIEENIQDTILMNEFRKKIKEAS